MSWRACGERVQFAARLSQRYFVVLVVFWHPMPSVATEPASGTYQRMVEWTVESQKTYSDPFNDVDVDVIFEHGGHSWRVPTFWRGGNRWTVRFAPPQPGEYTYRLESTDRANPDLNGHAGHVTVTAYAGDNELFKHGMLRVSNNKRYFEYTDGTPFYWLGDTWWSGLSTRLSWKGFQTLTADREKKGFTVVQIVAGLVPTEEQAPSDPGYCNEGGCVWDPEFTQINPKFFDFADRRIQYLLDHGIVPAIVGAWSEKIGQMGVPKLEKHWRYIVARYGAYPVFWVGGGEIFDPPDDIARGSNFMDGSERRNRGGWTQVVRYIRAVDPLHHPLTVHEVSADDLPLQEEALTDFDMTQPSHFSWASIAVEVSQLDTRYARRQVTKPVVVGEIGYERFGETHFEDFQRAAFWLGMLNGAAGHTYGANGTWESYASDAPFQRLKWSFMTWEEGMNLPGSYQVGLSSKLLRQFEWWRFTPHPEWVLPRGTTLLEPRDGIDRFHVDLSSEWGASREFGGTQTKSEWEKRHGNLRLPYAAGIPNEVRLIYIPYFGFGLPTSPTVLGLERNVPYHAYFWEPTHGIKVDLGTVERPRRGKLLRTDEFTGKSKSHWTVYGAPSPQTGGRLSMSGSSLAVLDDVQQLNTAATVNVSRSEDAGILMRFHNPTNYVAAVYSANEKVIYLVDRKGGVDGARLGAAPAANLEPPLELSAEIRGGWAAVSITDGKQTYTSEIVAISNLTAGTSGLLHAGQGLQSFSRFELRQSPPLAVDDRLDRKLYDARGAYRGTLAGKDLPELTDLGISSWDAFGKEKILLLDAYKPDRLPYRRDWILVLQRAH